MAEQPANNAVPESGGMAPLENSTPFEGALPTAFARLEDLYGYFPRVTTTPTWTPKKVQESFALNTSTGQIHWYDPSASTWRATATASLYTGAVVSSAAGTPFPSGWSLSHIATGHYRITHNLNNANTVPLLTPLGGSVNWWATRAANTVDFFLQTTGGADTDNDFSFLIST